MDSLTTALFSRGPGADLGLGDLLGRLLVAWLAGKAIGWFYSWSHGTMSYSQGFAQSTVLLSMVVAMIMCVVGDSLARAFGLGAALSVVRFRTPVKDARDATFLFLAVAAGMGAGVGMTGPALVGTAVVGTAATFSKWSAFGSRYGEEGVLRLHYLGEPEGREEIGRLLRLHCRSFQLSAARMARVGAAEELVYDVNLRASGDSLVRELIETVGVSGVSLLPQAHAGEA